MADYIATQPEPVPTMGRISVVSSKLKAAKTKVTTKTGWVGTFDYGWLCMPVLPWGNNRRHRRPAPFYGLEDDLPILIQCVTGLQHALAMIGGLVVPPIIISSSLALPASTQSFLISTSLISSGILSMLQMSRIKLFGRFYIGTGLITVVGTSFATLPPAAIMFDQMYRDGTCPSSVVNGVTVKGACPEAYGMLIGTMALCSLTSVALSCLPARQLRKIFPHVVTGTVICLIGISLIGSSGVLNWGGGSNCRGGPAGFFALCPNIAAPKPKPFGSPEMIGLGFLSFVTIILVELFGSPFMRNASIVLGLIVGCIVAGATGYINSSALNASPSITFLWVKTFPLKIYAPAILQGIAVYTILAVEATGDITASSEASRQPTSGPLFDSRVQGGILADGLGSLISCLFMSMPVSIFAQNNGVIILTKCANRGAGYMCATFIILFGILAKISGLVLSIPNSVLGGASTFLFAQVVTSGIKVLGSMSWSRKERFTLGCSLSIGIGNILVKDFLTHLFDGVSNPSSGLRGFLNSIQVVISTPYLAAFIVGVVIFNILPDEDDSSIVVRDDEVTPETSLEMGRVPGDEAAMPYKGQILDEENEDVKGSLGMQTKTRVEPAS